MQHRKHFTKHESCHVVKLIKLHCNFHLFVFALSDDVVTTISCVTAHISYKIISLKNKITVFAVLLSESFFTTTKINLHTSEMINKNI